MNEKKVSENTFRHELKYKIGYLQYMELKNRLKSVMQSDAHAGSDGKYLIRSIYFDNYLDKALREKTDGVPWREKFRIRYYNDDFSYIILEKESCSLHEIGCRNLRKRMPGFIGGQDSVDERAFFGAGTGIVYKDALSSASAKSAGILYTRAVYIRCGKCEDYI